MSVDIALRDDSGGNIRFVVRFADGAEAECVSYHGDSLCISTQVGCAVRCDFCASGKNGLSRPLSFDEMRQQVDVCANELGGLPKRITLSGVGEPLHNSENCRAFLDDCISRQLRVSLTTSGGHSERLVEWLNAPHQGLTISVHAGLEATRARLMPKAMTLSNLQSILREQIPTLGTRRLKKTALAYLLVKDANDSDADLDAFSEFACEIGRIVHLYDYNAHADAEFRGVGRERYEAIYQRLSDAGLHVRMSSQARLDDNGGCGTLLAKHRRGDKRLPIQPS